MIQPDFQTFCTLARQGNLVPVYETFTADLLTPVGAYLRLAKHSRYDVIRATGRKSHHRLSLRNG